MLPAGLFHPAGPRGEAPGQPGIFQLPVDWRRPSRGAVDPVAGFDISRHINWEKPDMKKSAFTVLGLSMAVSMLAMAPAMAEWPERPVTLIAPAGAGGGTDATARLLALGLEQHLGQPVNVVNQGQGGGVVGFTSITTADPDGYTLGVI